MDVITTYLHLPITDPTWIFFLVLCVVLFAPMIFSRLHIPHLIGMILAGVFLGRHGLSILERDASFELFGKVGIYFIMALAGLEMNMENLRANRVQGVLFGVITTLIPFAFGLGVGHWMLGYSMPASLLLACILASHTLVAYPIVSRYGVAGNPAVTVSVVATMVALLSALLVLAGLSGVLQGTGDVVFWLLFAVKLIAFLVGEFAIMPAMARYFFRHYTEPIMQFTFTLAAVSLSAAVAELCGLEGIFGAFLSGLVLNRFIPKTSPLMNRLEFVGNAIFVPYFLIGVGMLVNVAPLFNDGKSVAVVAIMVVAGTLSKYIAAVIARRMLGFSRVQRLVMFGLTEAHAAGALAMVMVGTRLYESPGVPLMSNAVLDGVVMMILLSCVISTVATEQGAKILKTESRLSLSLSQSGGRRDGTALDDEKILLPLNNIEKIRPLMYLAFMMRNKTLHRGLICLNIVNDADNSPQALAHSQECMSIASRIAAAADVPVQTQTRLGVNFVTATIHALRENDASEMLIGLHSKRHKGDGFYGKFGQGLLNDMSRQLMFARMTMPTNLMRSVVVAVPPRAEYEKGFYRWINRVARIAEDIGCTITYWATEETDQVIRQYMKERHADVRSDYEILYSWDDLPALRHELPDNALFVIVAARVGGISYQSSFQKLPQIIEGSFAKTSLLLVFPDQLDQAEDSFISGARTRGTAFSLSDAVNRWLSKFIEKI